MKEEEIREQEKAQLHANILKVKKEEEAEAVVKRERVRVRQTEITLANDAALRQKDAARATEKKLDDQITAHQRQR